MDFEAGYGDAGETARRAIAAGVVGGNLEDQMKPLDEASARSRPCLRAGRDAGIDFALNARTDAFVKAGDGRGPLGHPAGGDHARQGLPRRRCARRFRPGVVAREEIAALVEGLGRRKLTVISVPGASLPASELQELGVARVSTGPFAQRVALTALQDAAAGLFAGGALPESTRALN
jgi:2-methylisocitrate lyase-like PEP mutase family enzyme